jgi:hypothetical protein
MRKSGVVIDGPSVGEAFFDRLPQTIAVGRGGFSPAPAVYRVEGIGLPCWPRRPTARTFSVQETLLPLQGQAHGARATGAKRAQGAAEPAAEFPMDRRLLWRKQNGGLIVPEWGGPVDKEQYPVLQLLERTLGDRPILAVFDLQTKTIELAPEQIDALTEYLTARLTASGAYPCIPRSQLKDWRAAQKQQSYESCVDQACQLERVQPAATPRTASRPPIGPEPRLSPTSGRLP